MLKLCVVIVLVKLRMCDGHACTYYVEGRRELLDDGVNWELVLTRLSVKDESIMLLSFHLHIQGINVHTIRGFILLLVSRFQFPVAGVH